MRGRPISHRAHEALAFAVRIRVRILPGAPKKLIPNILSWLFARFGRDGFAHRRMSSGAEFLEVFFFRELEDAQEFLDAFPDLELANETAQVDASGDWVRSGNASAKG